MTASQKLFLQVETHMSFRYGFEKTDLKDSLLLISPDLLRFNSEAIETGNTTYASLDSFVLTDMSQQRVLSNDQRNSDVDINMQRMDINQSPIQQEGSDNKNLGFLQSSQRESRDKRSSRSLFENDDKNTNKSDSSFESIENEAEIALGLTKPIEIINISSAISDSSDLTQKPSTSKKEVPNENQPRNTPDKTPGPSGLPTKPITARKPSKLPRKPLSTFNRPINHDKEKEDKNKLTTRQRKRELEAKDCKTPSKKTKK